MLDIVCNLAYPAYETLFMLAKSERSEASSSAPAHLTTYWIFYTILCLVHQTIYWFPFSYEIRVIVALLMAHPKIQAATLIQQFLVTNPLIMIKVQDARNVLKIQLDIYLTKLRDFKI